MLILVIGLVLFMLPHLVREMGLRDGLMARFPGNAYRGIYSLFSLAGFGLIIWGFSLAPFVPLWSPAFDLRPVSFILMLPVFVLVVAGNMPMMSHIRKRLRNPMMAGTFLWGIAHLWANGDLASLLLFGSFTLWSGLKLISLRHNVGTDTPQVRNDIIAVAVGIVLFIIFLFAHGWLFGVGLRPA